MTACGVELVVIMACAAPAVAHDGELSLADKATLSRAVTVARDATRGGEAATLTGLTGVVEVLGGVSTDVLGHVEEIPVYAGLDAHARSVVDRYWRGVVLWRGLHTNVAPALSVAFGLSSYDGVEFAKAVEELVGLPCDEGLERAIVRLSRDPRAEVRLAAGIVAKMATALGEPREVLASVAMNLLADSDPRVVAEFMRHHVYEFGDARLVDRVVRAFEDDRSLPEAPLGFMNSGARTVKEAAVWAFGSQFMFRRFWRHDDEAGRKRLLEKGDPSQLKMWWAANRASWFGAREANGWLLLSDECRTVTVGAPIGIIAGKQELVVCLRKLDVATGSGEPVGTISFELKESDKDGNTLVEFESVSQRLSWVAVAQNGRWIVEVLTAPRSEKTARVRWWIWKLGEERELR